MFHLQLAAMSHHNTKSLKSSSTPSSSERENVESLNPTQSSAWASIRQHQDEVAKAASRLETLTLAPTEHESDLTTPATAAVAARPLSALERLPEEILLEIMKGLDHESLYRFSQTTGYFLRLSFDEVFESDGAWRTFRHTVDYLNGGGAGKRVQHGIGAGIGIGDEPRRTGKKPLGTSAPSSWPLTYGVDGGKGGEKNVLKGGTNTRPLLALSNSKDSAGLGSRDGDSDGYYNNDDDDDNEGETMLEFLSRSS